MVKVKKFLKWELLFDTCLFLCIFFVYWHNATRDIYGGDVGDFTTASYFLGVAHPSGYPLFTMLGYIFTLLSINEPVVFKVSLVSLFASLGGLIIFFWFCLKISRSRIISWVSTLVVAFIYLYWFYAELAEVFALNNFIAMVLISSALLFYNFKKKIYLYIIAFFIGISITHHQTIIFIYPTVFLLTIKHWKVIFSSKGNILRLIICFIIGLLPLLYIPIAASRNPIVNWDNVHDVSSFINLFLRKDYGIAPALIQSETPLISKAFMIRDFFITMYSNFTIFGLIFILLGSWFLLRNKKFLIFISLFIGFILTGPFFVYYGTPIVSSRFWIGVLERFYILSFIVASFFIPYGLLFIRQILQKFYLTKRYSSLLLCFLFFIPLYLFRLNFAACDLSKNTIGNNFAIDILSSLPKNAAIFVQGDTVDFNLWYVHYVLGVRPDVLVLPPQGTGGISKPWTQLDQIYFKTHDKRNNIPEYLRSIMIELKKKRPIFMYNMYLVPADSEYLWVPYGLSEEFTAIKDVPERDTYLTKVKELVKKLHIPYKNNLRISERGFTVEETPLYYSNGIARIGAFLYYQYKDYVGEREFYLRALEIDSTNQYALGGLAMNYLDYKRDCSLAEKYVSTSIESSFINLVSAKTYYKSLYTIYSQCDKKKLQKLSDEYKEVFKENIQASSSGVFRDNKK